MTATGKKAERATLATTYYGVEGLRLLDAIASVKTPQTVAFIQRYREPGRGFARVPGGRSSPQSTYMGVRALQSLGAITDDLRSEVIAYLKDTRYSGLVEGRQYHGLPNVEAMAATLETLAVLSAVEQLNTAKIREFIDSLYVPQNGGFGPRPRQGTTPPSTFHALLGLVRLGALPEPFAGPQAPGIGTAAP